MAKVYKRLILLMLLVGGISGAVIYFTVDINTLRHLTSFRPWSLAAAVFFLAVGLYFDGTRLMHLVCISGEKISLIEAVQVVFGNYFLALLTPGAAGGAVAQVMFLRRAGVPTGKATVLVVVRTILSILFLLCALPLVFYYDPDLMPWLSQGTLAAGSTLIVAGILGGILLFRTTLPHYLLIKFTKRLSHSRRRTVFAIYRDVLGAVLLLSTAPFKMMRVFVESAISLLFLYSVVPVLFMGIGAQADWLRILGRMIFLNIFLYFAPTPGGSGIAEGGFILLFNDFVPSGMIGIAAVAWRIMAEYLPFSIGLYYTIRVFGRGFLTKQLSK
ncbi:MAG: flippase-like domain-containing protein [Pelosinus sp.]|nr:flippase-like domain-containing protein [Pelosinus sp.]